MAYEFASASNQYLQLDSAPVTVAPATMCCWFRLSDVSHANALMWIGQRTSIRYWRLWCEDVGGNYSLLSQVRISSVAAVSRALPGVSADTWYFAAATVGPASSYTLSTILGTARESTAGYNLTSTVDGFAIGRESNSTPRNYADAAIAHAALWSINLTADQLAALAAGASPLSIQPDNLVRYDPLIRDLREPVGGAQLTAYNSPTIYPHPPVRWVATAMYGVPAAAAASAALLMQHHHHSEFHGGGHQ